MLRVLLFFFFLLGAGGVFFLNPGAIRAEDVIIEAPKSADYEARIDVRVLNCRDNTTRCEVSLWHSDQKIKALYCHTNNCFYGGNFSIPERGRPRQVTISVISNEGGVLVEKDIEITGTPRCRFDDRVCLIDADCKVQDDPSECQDFHCIDTVMPPLGPEGPPLIFKTCQHKPGYVPPPTPTVPVPCVTGKFSREKGCEEVETGIGRISTDPGGLVSFLLKFILYLSGGITLLLIIYGGYRLMTSQGNPEKLQEAKETITSAIVGLLFIIFSLVLLEIIGVDILRIPGFAK